MNIKKFKKPIYVDFSLTPYCNLKCGFCYASACGRMSKNLELNIEDFKRIFDQLDELDVLRIGFEGGEPFLRNDIIDILKEADKHNFTYFINTNGTLITDSIAESLSKTDVDKVCVSIDGPNSEINDNSRGVNGAFKLMQKGVKNLLKYNIKVDGVLTLSNINKKYVVETFKYMADLGIKNAVIMMLAAVGSNDKDSYGISFNDWEEILLKLTDLKKENNLPVEVSIVPPGEGKCSWELLLPLYLANREEDIKYWKNNNLITTLNENDYGCTAGKDNFCIDGYGKVYGCSMMVSIPQLCAGDAKKDTLSNIWFNSEVFNKLRNSSINNVEGKCKSCSFNDKCMGGCRACAYQINLNINDSDPRCPITKKEVTIDGKKN